MASFTQDLPNVAPDPLAYTRLAKGIETPKPDTSKATLISGVTNAVETGITGVDEGLKKHYEYQGEQFGEEAQSKAVAELQDLDKKTLNAPKSNLPQTVQEGLDFIQRNEDAKNQGKIRETEYYRNLYEKARSVRMNNPSYAADFDRGVEKITGVGPSANKYMASLLAQINERVGKTDKVWEDALNDARAANREGYAGMDRVVIGAQNRTMPLDEIYKRVNQANSIKAATQGVEYQIKQNTLTEGNDKLAQRDATNHIADTVAKTYSDAVNGLMVDIGGGPQRVKDLEDKIARGEITISDDQAQSMAALITNEKNKARAYLDKLFSSSTPGADGKPGKSLRSIAADGYEKAIDSGFAQYKDDMDAYTNKDMGFSLRQHRAVDAFANNAAWESTKNAGLRTILAIGAAAHRIGGDQLVNNLEQKLLGRELTVQDRNSISDIVKSLSLGKTFKGIPGISSWNDAVDAAINSSRNPATGEGPNPAAVKAVAELPAQVLLDKDTPDDIKKEWIIKSFNPKNEGVLSKIKMDEGSVQGRYSIFQFLTGQGVVSEVNRLSADQPQLKQYYQGWVDSSFDHDLFSEDMKKLSVLQKAPNYEIGYNDTDKPPKFFIHQFYRSGRAPPVRGEVASGDIQQSITNINKGLEGMYNVHAESDPEMVKTYITRLLIANGIDVNQGNSVARSMAIAIGGSKKQEKPKDDSRAGQPQ